MNGFLRSLRLERDRVPSFDEYPFRIPAIRDLDELELDPKCTFLVGDNGSGKSTLIEAIAVAAGFNAEGGSKSFKFATRSSESALHRYVRIARGWKRERDGFFLRAESYFNLATEIEALGVIDSYGGRSLHEQSHGESFLALALHRFHDKSLFVLDEPEAALSPSKQLTMLAIMRDLIERGGSQFIIATHSPILLAYPGARIYLLDGDGLRLVEYEDTEHYQITRTFLQSPRLFLERMFRDDKLPED